TSVMVQQPQLSLSIEGQPATKYVGRPADWYLTVANPSSAVVNNVVVRDRLPFELGFANADQGGRVEDGEVVWNVGPLQPGEKRMLKLTTIGKEAGRGALHTATASAEPDLRVQAQVTVDVVKTPDAVRLEMGDTSDPVQVGKIVTYYVRVTNTG